MVAAIASPATSGDGHVTWEQVSEALAAARHEPPDPARGAPSQGRLPSAGGTSASIAITVTVPDLSWAIEDPTADPAVRRAACHQATGLDDEAATPLAACLAHIAGATQVRTASRGAG